MEGAAGVVTKIFMVTEKNLNLPFGIKPQYFSFLILGLIVIASGIWLIITKIPQNTLAQCLKQNGVIMYGSDTCENCINQKSFLGTDFKNINYVNCDFEEKICKEKGINVYPVWMRGDKILTGVQSLEKLKEFGECSL